MTPEDLTVIKDRIRRWKLNSTTYWQMSEKLNMPQEEIKKLGKEFPWAKPAHSRYIKQERIPETTSPETTLSNQPKTLNVGILSRFMKEEEIATFLQQYQSNTRSKGASNRQSILQQPLLKENLEILKAYVTDFDIKLVDLAKERGLTLHNLYTKVLRVAIKVVAQNPSVLDKYFEKDPKKDSLD